MMNAIKKSEKRKARAKKLVQRRMLYAGGLGLVPLPIVDAAGILGIQVLTVKDIAKIYKIPFKGQLAKSLIGSLVGTLGTAGIAKAIPGLGTVVGAATMAMTGMAATYAIGKVFTLHFEQGGTLLDFDPVKSRKYFEQAIREGEISAAALKNANNGRFAKTFQPVLQNGASLSSNKTFTEQDIAKRAEENATYEAYLAKATRLNMLKAKKRRKIKFKKTLRQLILLIIFMPLASAFFNKYIKPRFGQFQDVVPSNEIELFLKENTAKEYNLKSATDIDSTLLINISKFSPVSTEAVISRYLQNPKSTYPRRYSLNAVRFVGTSEKISSGAKEQLSNIALLMKKYPELLVNIYGHTGSKGPVFNRQRIGRDRSRVLKDVFIEQDISSYRITGNYIEKQDAVEDGYWGAEIVLHVATIESVVEVAPRSLEIEAGGQVLDAVTGIIGTAGNNQSNSNNNIEGKSTKSRGIRNKSSDQLSTLDQSSAVNLQEVYENKRASRDRNTVLSPPVEKDSSSTLVEIEIQQEQSIVDSLDTTTPKIKDTLVKESVNLSSKIAKQDSAKKTAPALTKSPKPTPKSPTVIGVMQHYIESSNPKYPKVFPLINVRFKGESTAIDDKGKAQLKNIAELLQNNPNMRITVNGDAAGKTTVSSEDEKNQFLVKWQGIGQKRGRTIKKFLHDQGIANKRIKTGFRLQSKAADTAIWGADLVIESN